MTKKSAYGLSDRLWEKIRPRLAQGRAERSEGRPRADDRRCFEGVLWILWTRRSWHKLPKRYGSPTTCWRRFVEWTRNGALPAVLEAFEDDLGTEARFDRQDVFLDCRPAVKKPSSPSMLSSL